MKLEFEFDPGRPRSLPALAHTTGAPDWKLFFSDQAVDGTIVIADERSGEMLAYDVERAQKRFMPASTFKVPHALFALDAGAVRDEFRDSVGWRKRDFDGWNQDQTLRSSMRHSTVWVSAAVCP